MVCTGGEREEMAVLVHDDRSVFIQLIYYYYVETLRKLLATDLVVLILGLVEKTAAQLSPWIPVTPSRRFRELRQMERALAPLHGRSSVAPVLESRTRREQR
ncbi:hypothetical protein TNCV_2948611 [Trichonephila clavipes]|nr:hypothetical protein TNCV_2948611 [Trichonephila clavipes]